MKHLVRLMAALALLWSLLWIAGSVTVERLVAGWLDQQGRAGWVVGYETLGTSGYPLRFDTRLTDLRLADPATGWAWTAPELHLDQFSARPLAIRAIWPSAQSFATPFETVTITADRMESLLHVQARSDLALNRSETIFNRVAMRSDLGWSSAIDSATLRFSLRDEPGHRYDLRFDAEGFVPTGQLLALLDPAGLLPQQVERFRLSAVTAFDRPWDLTALEVSRPNVTRLELEEMRAEWGDLALRVSGTLDVDPQGLPTGNLSVRAQNWREMVTLGANAGAIPDGFRGTLETGLSLMAGLSGRPEDLDATLRFAEGQVYFGPIPLGPAPRLVLR